MTQRRTLSLIGLARTGKSTYLGALWMIIQDDRATYIRELETKGDRSYLTKLGDQVALLREMARTDVDSEEGLQLIVELGDLGEVDLRIPDLSGETLRLLVEHRTWHELLRDAITGSDALLLFVHPDRVWEPTRTNFTADLLSKLMTTAADQSETGGTATAPTEEAGIESDPDPPTFTPKLAATAAKLIDAVENILNTNARQTLKIGVVISAWDLAEKAWPADEGMATPRRWLEHRLPAVWQVLRSNPDRLNIAVYGVSAVGGRLPEDREELEGKGSVLDRAYVLDGEGNPVRFTAPLEWALTWP